MPRRPSPNAAKHWPVPLLLPRDRRLAAVLWRGGAMSRSDLHRLTGVHPNLVGVSASRLIEQGVLRETKSVAEGRGRPGAALEVDAHSRHVLGLAISPGVVELSRLNLLGQPLEPPQQATFERDEMLTAVASRLMKKALNEQTLAIGISATGLIDPKQRTLLFSSSAPDSRNISLAPLFAAAGDRPVVLDNDQHAIAAWWLLGQRVDLEEDIVLVCLRDGRLGASIMTGGPPNRGCVLAANELGHNRLPVETPRCYCGHIGCLERICSTAYLRQLGSRRTFASVLAQPGADASHWMTIADHLAYGLANTTNLIRPNRVVVMSPLEGIEAFAGAIESKLRPRLLPSLAERIQFEHAAIPGTAESIATGWLGLAWVFHPAWAGVGETADS